MKTSSTRKNISRIRARNATWLNLLATPGLGSLMAGRWFAGTGQVVLAILGFLLALLWAGEQLFAYYGQVFSDAPAQKSVPLTMLIVGMALFALAWIWSAVTSFHLHREAAHVSLQSLENFAGGLMKATESQITTALAQLPEWRRNGDVIVRTFQFKDFPGAMKFVNDVAQLAEQAQHHPDVDIRWNKVTLALSTHDAGGLTQKDFALAGECDALAG